MKKLNLKITKAIFILFSLVCLFSCSCNNKNQEGCLLSSNLENKNLYEHFLSGKHELRKFNIKTTTSTKSIGSFFLIVGSYSSETIEESKIRFYFMTINGEYIFKEMDFNKVIIKIDNTTQTPYVKFYWRNRGCQSEYKIYENSITRAVIYCKEEDFQPEININELK